MSADPQVVLTNGAGEVASLDLAEPSTRVTTQQPPMGESGSAYDSDRIFTRFDDGRYFATQDYWPRDFEEMLRLDGKARSLEQVLTLPLLSADHSIEPAQGDNGEAEFITDALERPATQGGMSTPLDMVVGQMTSAVVLKRAYFEKVFKADGGKVTYDKLAFRPQSTCWLLRDKQTYAFRGFKQKFMTATDLEEVVIPPEKAFVYIHGQYRDPLYGVSSLATARALYESKQKIRFLWYSFLENQVLPKVVVETAVNDPGEQQAIANKVAALKNAGVVALGPNQSVDAVSVAGDGGSEFRSAIAYLDTEMAGSVLAGFTELPSAAQLGRGSYALSESQTDFFKLSLEATLTEMSASFTHHAVADLVLYNFGPDAAVPTFTFKQPQPEAVDKAITLLQSLATANVPAPPIPREFIDLLTEKVSGYLGIPVDQVHTAIQNAQAQQPNTPAGKLVGGANAATALAASAGFPVPGQVAKPSQLPQGAAA